MVSTRMGVAEAAAASRDRLMKTRMTAVEWDVDGRRDRYTDKEMQKAHSDRPRAMDGLEIDDEDGEE